MSCPVSCPVTRRGGGQPGRKNQRIGGRAGITDPEKRLNYQAATWLTEAEYGQMQRLADEGGISMSKLIREALVVQYALPQLEAAPARGPKPASIYLRVAG